MLFFMLFCADIRILRMLDPKVKLEGSHISYLKFNDSYSTSA